MFPALNKFLSFIELVWIYSCPVKLIRKLLHFIIEKGVLLRTSTGSNWFVENGKYRVKTIHWGFDSSYNGLKWNRIWGLTYKTPGKQKCAIKTITRPDLVLHYWTPPACQGSNCKRERYKEGKVWSEKSHQTCWKAGRHLNLYSLIGRRRAFTADSVYNVGRQPNWAMPLIYAVHSCSILNSLNRPTFKLGYIFKQ